ncbi:glycosyltransferase [Geobacter sulfurreducens]|uniref:glycosyltransferase n=1 Tax=Geobacter sulfurreducens TaxID=35554 RepID=UPI001BDCE8A7|nr:glycosyltransferase [Geobacter sulfurreducens]QVW33811.1 glycosyltransferase [Geobacter sulfurreducens]
MTSHVKPAVAVYLQHYLTVSMTFVYRQLLGVKDEFDPIVLAGSVSNLDTFPIGTVYQIGRTIPEKAYCKLVRVLAGKHAVLSPLQIRYWKKILKDNRVKLIHAHFGPAGLEALPLAKALDIPLLVTFHGYDASSLLNDTTYCSNLRDLFEYANIIAVSNVMLDKLRELGARPERTHLHYIGVPLDDFKFIPRIALNKSGRGNDPIRFLQVSNFVEKKGHRYTIQAFNDFLLRRPNSTLTFGGDGPLLSDIKKLCEDLGIKDKVQFVGSVTKQQVVELMENADVFLHHSVTANNGDQEGIPTVLMEAMATGLTVISTYHSGIPELIEDGQTGFLVHERDIGEYVDKMLIAVNSSPEIPLRAARSIQEKYNIKYQNEKLKEIYGAVTER